MFAYGIGLLTLICQFKAEFPEVEQAWYVDDAGVDDISQRSPHLSQIARDRSKFWIQPGAVKEHPCSVSAQLRSSKGSLPRLGLQRQHGKSLSCTIHR